MERDGLYRKCVEHIDRNKLPEDIVLTEELLEKIILASFKYFKACSEWGNERIQDVLDIVKSVVLKDHYFKGQEKVNSGEQKDDM